MRIRLKCLKDNFIDSKTANQLVNYGYSNLLQIHKNEDSIARIITKFDIASLYSYMSAHSLALSSITSATLTYYDISNYTFLDKSFTSANSFTNSEIELQFLSQNWDEGIGDTVKNPPISGYSNYLYAQDSVLWSSSGGSISSVTSITAATQTFTSGYDDIELDVLDEITYLQGIYSASALDLNKGFLIKLTNAIEAGSVTYDDKQVISLDTQTSFKPEIICEWNKVFKDEQTSFEYGRDNTFGIVNYDILTLQDKNIASISTVTLSAYASSTSVSAEQISISSSVEFTTVKRGYHTFDFEIPNSLSSYVNPFLTITYSDGLTKTITKALDQSLLLDTDDISNILNGTSQLKFKSTYVPEFNVDDNEFLIIKFQAYLYDTSNQVLGFIFDQDKKVAKNLFYRIYDKNNKIIQPVDYTFFNQYQNFILLHNSLLESGTEYYMDLYFNSITYSKFITFRTE